MADVRKTIKDALFALVAFAAYLFFIFLASSSLFALFSPSIPLWSGILLIIVGLVGILVVWSLTTSYAQKGSSFEGR